MERSKRCGTNWLHYLVECEAFSVSGRWFRAPISEAALAVLTPEQAVPFPEQQPWLFVGGSHYQSPGRHSTGLIRADLL